MSGDGLDRMTVSVVQEARPAIEQVRVDDDQASYQLAMAAVATGAADDELMKALARHRGDGGEEGLFSTLGEAVKALFARTRTVERKRERARWRWPLFLLGAPAVDGAELEVSVSEERSRAHGWSLELFGAGVERKATVSVSDSFKLEAHAGQTRLWFIEHDVDVVDLEIQRGGKPVGEGQRIELVGGRAVGVADLDAWPAWASSLEVIEALRYREVRASPAPEWNQTERRSGEYELVLGVDLKPLRLGATGSYQLSRSVELRASLPGGHDWELSRPTVCPGIAARAAGPG